jgi:glutamine cyclotransferase
MMQIQVRVMNGTSEDQQISVFDLFADGQREVDNSPFALASGETSISFIVNANSARVGRIQCQGQGAGLTKNVENNDVVSVAD